MIEFRVSYIYVYSFEIREKNKILKFIMERVSYRYSLKMGEKNEILKFFIEVYLFLRIFFVIIMKKFV